MINALLICTVFALSACGFTPVYAPQDNRDVASDLAQIQIDNIPNRSGQILRNHLVDRLYPKGRQGQDIHYHLSVSLAESLSGVSIARDATVTRSQSYMVATINLMDVKTGEVILTRQLTATSAYNVLPSQFGTLVTEQDARERSLQALADRITTALSLYFKRQQNPS